MYVDEVGNNDIESSDDPNHRYLSLTGVFLDLEYVRDVLHPEMEQLKNDFFGAHPDEPIILHRKELVNKRHPFMALRRPGVESAFNSRLIEMITRWDFGAITVIIDKRQHRAQYGMWRYDPYHYCQEILIERYVLHLNRLGHVGDVMAESRGGKEDMRLKRSFHRLYGNGTNHVASATIQRVFTSRELKVKRKGDNIAGLQLADLVAHPAWISALAKENIRPVPNNFGTQIAAILDRDKYLRSPQGRIAGWGCKWLPGMEKGS